MAEAAWLLALDEKEWMCPRCEPERNDIIATLKAYKTSFSNHLEHGGPIARESLPGLRPDLVATEKAYMTSRTTVPRDLAEADHLATSRTQTTIQDLKSIGVTDPAGHLRRLRTASFSSYFARFGKVTCDPSDQIRKGLVGLEFRLYSMVTEGADYYSQVLQSGTWANDQSDWDDIVVRLG